MKDLTKTAKYIIITLLFALLLLVNPLSLDGGWVGLYSLPSLVLWVIYINFEGYSTLSEDEKSRINKEKINSILRSLIKGFGTLLMMSGMVGLHIPYAEQINDALNHIMTGLDDIIQAILVIWGAITYMYGLFVKDKGRFKERALIEGRRIKV